MHRQLDEKERQNNKDRQAFSEQTSAQEKRHQQSTTQQNKLLNDTIVKMQNDFETLRKKKDAEIKQLKVESEKQRS